MDRLTALTADRVRLSLRRFGCAGERRAVLLCTHAMMARGRYVRRFAEHLAGRGVETYVLDWRGHGDSVPPSPRVDDWCFDDYVELDLPAAVTAVCGAARIAPAELCYLGHSLGGLAGLAAFGTGVVPSPRRLALFATSVWLPGPDGSAVRRWLMRLYRAAARPLGYAPVTRLGLGSDDETRGYVDQLTGWALAGRWTSRTGVDYMAQVARVESPTLPVCGTGDRLCSPADAREITRRLPNAHPVRGVDADHFTLFTEERLSPLWDELVTFLE